MSDFIIKITFHVTRPAILMYNASLKNLLSKQVPRLIYYCSYIYVEALDFAGK